MTTVSMIRSVHQLLIGGQWETPAGDLTVEVFTPFSEEWIAAVPDPTVTDMDAAVARSMQRHREAARLGPGRGELERDELSANRYRLDGLNQGGQDLADGKNLRGLTECPG